jgi:hypothetical protein
MKFHFGVSGVTRLRVIFLSVRIEYNTNYILIKIMSTATQQSSTAKRDVFNTGHNTEPNTVALKREPNWALVTPALAGSTTALSKFIQQFFDF